MAGEKHGTFKDGGFPNGFDIAEGTNALLLIQNSKKETNVLNFNLKEIKKKKTLKCNQTPLMSQILFEGLGKKSALNIIQNFVLKRETIKSRNIILIKFNSHLFPSVTIYIDVKKMYKNEKKMFNCKNL